MRIAHIITRLIIGGAQENTLLNCEDLIRDHGDEVLLLTGPTTGPEGTLMDRARQSVPTRIVPDLIRSISPWHEIRAYRQLRQALKEFQPDVVHTHSAKAGILGRAVAWSLRNDLGRPVVVHTVHGAPFYPYQNPPVREFYKSCERWAARRCDAMISVADAMTDLMVDARIAPREKFRTIYSGMEVEPFLQSDILRTKTRREFGFADEDIVIGKIARLFTLKGHEYVINAAREILRRSPRARFFFVGDGILTEKYKTEIARQGLEERFVFAGLVPPGRIPALISAMDIVVHTSLREGLARVLPQALLSGKPVVSFDIDGAREVVMNDETGFLILPKDIAALADAIVRLADDPDLRDKMGRAGRERFARRFDHRHMTEQIRELYIEKSKEQGKT